MEGSLGFWPRASWKGEKPYTFCSEFFAFVHHAKAASKEHFDSSRTLSNISLKIKLCLSIGPFDQGNSALVILKLMLRLSYISMNFSFANSPPLSDKNWSAKPKTLIQFLRILLMITSGFFEEDTILLHDQQGEV